VLAKILSLWERLGVTRLCPALPAGLYKLAFAVVLVGEVRAGCVVLDMMVSFVVAIALDATTLAKSLATSVVVGLESYSGSSKSSGTHPYATSSPSSAFPSTQISSQPHRFIHPGQKRCASAL
jgi:hypothetical protein